MDNNGEFLLLAAVKVAASSGESGEKELFRQIDADVLRAGSVPWLHYAPLCPREGR
jgi:hypothetical protein